MDKLRLEWWDNFNDELYCNYLIQKDELMNTYRILYKTYKGNNTDAPVVQAIKYVQAYDKTEARKLFNLWQGLIISIEKV